MNSKLAAIILIVAGVWMIFGIFIPDYTVALVRDITASVLITLGVALILFARKDDDKS